MPFSRKLNFAGKGQSCGDPSTRSPGRAGQEQEEEEGGQCQERGLGAGIGAACCPEHLTVWTSHILQQGRELLCLWRARTEGFGWVTVPAVLHLGVSAVP